MVELHGARPGNWELALGSVAIKVLICALPWRTRNAARFHHLIEQPLPHHALKSPHVKTFERRPSGCGAVVHGRHPKLFTKSAVQVENYPSALPSKADLDDQAFGLESAGTTNVGQ